MAMKRERVIFQTPTTVSDGAGGTKKTGWVDVYTCWADIKLRGGSRDMEDTQLRGRVVYDAQIRHQGDVFTPTADMAVLWRSKRYTIHGTPHVVPYEDIKLVIHG